MTTPLPILRGPQFERRLAEVAADGFEVVPLEGLKNKRVLVPGLIGGELQFATLGLLAQALRLRGAEVTALMCDAFLPICSIRKVDHHERACERWCYRNAPGFAASLRIPHRWYSELITDEELRECDRLSDTIRPQDLADLVYRDVALSEHVLRALESYHKVGTPDFGDPSVLLAFRGFVRAAMYLTNIGHRALRDLRIEKVLINDGKKTDWGVIRDVAGSLGIPVDVVGDGIRGLSLRFETDRGGRRGIRMPGWERWREVPLTPEQERELDEYLARRACRPFDFRDECWHLNTCDAETIRQRIGLPAEIRGLVFSLFSNVGFDSGTTSTSAAAFRSAREWILDTLGVLGRHPQHHLIIKAHPAEHRRQACDRVLDLLRHHDADLPSNVHLIHPEDDIAGQSVAMLSDVALVYTSTVGVEAAALGKPVVLAGGGWNSGRGFMVDVATAEEYECLLEGMCARNEPCRRDVELARRYAYSLFFRNDIPIEHFTRRNYHPTSLELETLNDLRPGRFPSIDAICRGVLCDEPFVNPHSDGLQLLGSHPQVLNVAG